MNPPLSFALVNGMDQTMETRYRGLATNDAAPKRVLFDLPPLLPRHLWFTIHTRCSPVWRLTLLDFKNLPVKVRRLSLRFALNHAPITLFFLSSGTPIALVKSSAVTSVPAGRELSSCSARTRHVCTRSASIASSIPFVAVFHPV